MIVRSLGLVALVLFLGSGLPARAADTPDLFITDLGNELIAAAERPGITQQEIESEIRQVLAARFNVVTMGAFALGSYWSDTTRDQKIAYLDAYQVYVTNLYAGQFIDLAGASFSIDETRMQPDGDTLVQARLSVPDAQAFPIVFRVRERDSTFRILDVLVRNISLLQLHREEFQAVLQQNGGNVDDLIQAIQQAN